MLSIDDCRKILAETAKDLSDMEVLDIRDQLRELAGIALETQARPAMGRKPCRK